MVRIAAERGRAARPDLKLGICGEHGGDPASIHFCREVGLDYVSCSPYRVPIARLAAAQAELAGECGMPRRDPTRPRSSRSPSSPCRRRRAAAHPHDHAAVLTIPGVTSRPGSRGAPRRWRRRSTPVIAPRPKRAVTNPDPTGRPHSPNTLSRDLRPPIRRRSCRGRSTSKTMTAYRIRSPGAAMAIAGPTTRVLASTQRGREILQQLNAPDMQ